MASKTTERMRTHGRARRHKRRAGSTTARVGKKRHFLIVWNLQLDQYLKYDISASDEPAERFRGVCLFTGPRWAQYVSHKAVTCRAWTLLSRVHTLTSWGGKKLIYPRHANGKYTNKVHREENGVGVLGSVPRCGDCERCKACQHLALIIGQKGHCRKIPGRRRTLGTVRYRPGLLKLVISTKRIHEWINELLLYYWHEN